MKVISHHFIPLLSFIICFSLPIKDNLTAQSKGKSLHCVDHFSTLAPNYKYDSLFANKSEYYAKSFGVPLGIPDGAGYYNAKPFWAGYSNLNHLGEDWSGEGDGNSDFGDTIYAIASGYVSFSKDLEFTWGGVVGIIHQVKNKINVFEDETIVHDSCKMERGKHRYIKSFYAHCNTQMVKQGQWVKKGEPIGTMGNSGGRFMAHLHFEMRPNADAEIYDGGYSNSKDGFIEPSKFMKAYNQN